jgi:hypothetical protein
MVRADEKCERRIREDAAFAGAMTALMLLAFVARDLSRRRVIDESDQRRLWLLRSFAACVLSYLPRFSAA